MSKTKRKANRRYKRKTRRRNSKRKQKIGGNPPTPPEEFDFNLEGLESPSHKIIDIKSPVEDEAFKSLIKRNIKSPVEDDEAFKSLIKQNIDEPLTKKRKFEESLPRQLNFYDYKRDLIRQVNTHQKIYEDAWTDENNITLNIPLREILASYFLLGDKTSIVKTITSKLTGKKYNIGVTPTFYHYVINTFDNGSRFFYNKTLSNILKKNPEERQKYR